MKTLLLALILSVGCSKSVVQVHAKCVQDVLNNPLAQALAADTDPAALAEFVCLDQELMSDYQTDKVNELIKQLADERQADK
jgi:hypothetical protein